MNRRVRGRGDDSDILQEAFLDATRKLVDYAAAPILPFYLWIGRLAELELAEAHRRHLGTGAREVSLHRGCLPPADTDSLAAQLLGTLT